MPPEPPVNPFAPPAARDVPPPLGLPGAVRIENGTELPHRCVYCNAASDLQRVELEATGLPSDDRLWVCVLAFTFFLAPVAALSNRQRRRRAKFTASMCRTAPSNSVCARQRKDSIEAQDWENLPILGAGIVGFLQGSWQTFSFTARMIPAWNDAPLIPMAILSVLVISVFGLLQLADSDETPNGLRVNVDHGFRLLGCGKEFVNGLPDELRADLHPPAGDEPPA